MKGKKLYRSIDDYMLAGVCGGLADYFEIDSSLIRIIFILLILCGGGGVLIYLILWIMVPKEEGEEIEIDHEEKVKEFAKDVKGKAKSMAKEIRKDVKVKRPGKRINVLGVMFILIGVVAIWNQIAPMRIDWDFFWPGLLVVIGVLLLFK